MRFIICIFLVLSWIHPVNGQNGVVFGANNFAKQDVRYLLTSHQRDSIIKFAIQEIGVRETSPNHGKRIKEYLSVCKLPEGYDYCAAFCSFILLKSYYSVYGEQESVGKLNNKPFAKAMINPWAPSWFRSDRLIYLRQKFQIKSPEKGDFVGYYNDQSKRISHIGILEKWGNKYAITIEANVGNPQGVYRLYRSKKMIYAVSRWVE